MFLLLGLEKNYILLTISGKDTCYVIPYTSEDVEWYFPVVDNLVNVAGEAGHSCRKAQELFLMETVPRFSLSLVRTAFLFPFCTYLKK